MDGEPQTEPDAPGRPPRPARGLGWLPVAVLSVVLAVLLGAMIGPAGPPWWRVPLALIDHLPLISIDSGVSTGKTLRRCQSARRA